MNDCPFRYQGQYEDEETGLYYNRFRYYDPSTGAYISQDPIGLAGGNPTLYGYVSDTNSWVDTLGLECTKLNKNKLPELPETFAREFETLRIKRIKKGTKLYRSPWIPNETTDSAGKWFGTRKTTTAKGTDSMYQIEKWGNPNKVQRVYEVTDDIYVYYGKVKGGTGYQVLLPKDVTPSEVLIYKSEHILQ